MRIRTAAVVFAFAVLLGGDYMSKKITENFTLEEMFRSETAERRRIDNRPSADIEANLTYLVKNVLQPLKTGQSEVRRLRGIPTDAQQTSRFLPAGYLSRKSLNTSTATFRILN